MPALFRQQEAVSVSELTRQVRELLEGEFGELWIEGEISNLRKHASGHQYFSLKDQGAQLRCVWFRGNSQFSSVQLRDGLQVQVFGEISVYEAQGQYQCIVRVVQARGQGALQAKFEALKRKLEAEGLFDPAGKQEIPRFPKTIAMVTSPTGAALRDMLNILSRRAPWVRLIIAPARVQGEGAAVEIVAALKRVIRLSGTKLPNIDTIVLARGGGSIEDLWNFNEEIVARAISDCPIPTVSAIGHEIDFTIADFVADLRAPTPSAAAELVVPDRSELVQQLQRSQTRLTNVLGTRIGHWNKVLAMVAKSGAFREPGRAVANHRQTLDRLAEDLREAAKTAIASQRDRLVSGERMLAASRPEALVERNRERLSAIANRLTLTQSSQIQRADQQLQAIRKLLKTLGPDSTLARGYSLTTDASGSIVTDSSELKCGQRLITKLAKGEFESEVVNSD